MSVDLTLEKICEHNSSIRGCIVTAGSRVFQNLPEAYGLSEHEKVAETIGNILTLTDGLEETDGAADLAFIEYDGHSLMGTRLDEGVLVLVCDPVKKAGFRKIQVGLKLFRGQLDEALKEEAAFQSITSPTAAPPPTNPPQPEMGFDHAPPRRPLNEPPPRYVPGQPPPEFSPEELPTRSVLRDQIGEPGFNETAPMRLESPQPAPRRNPPPLVPDPNDFVPAPEARPTLRADPRPNPRPELRNELRAERQPAPPPAPEPQPDVDPEPEVAEEKPVKKKKKRFYRGIEY